MTAPELKPCPFCGGEASISKDHDPDGNGAFYAVKCRKCRAKSPEIYAVETCNIHFAQVRDAWNRRADLAAVQPAQVRVKPLVFNFLNLRRYAYSAHSIVGYYEIHHEADLFSVWYSGSRIQHVIPTIDLAKAAAQADYEARIFAALETQPDPRDEVIKGLVDAVEDVMNGENRRMGQKFDANSGSFDLSVQSAALAAAKAVQHG